MLCPVFKIALIPPHAARKILYKLYCNKTNILRSHVGRVQKEVFYLEMFFAADQLRKTYNTLILFPSFLLSSLILSPSSLFAPV
jgi:hypothetical protein